MKKQTAHNIELILGSLPYVIGAILAGMFYFLGYNEYFWYTVIFVVVYILAKEVVPHWLVQGRRSLANLNRNWYFLGVTLLIWRIFQVSFEGDLSGALWLVGNGVFLATTLLFAWRVYLQLRREFTGMATNESEQNSLDT